MEQYDLPRCGARAMQPPSGHKEATKHHNHTTRAQTEENTTTLNVWMFWCWRHRPQKQLTLVSVFDQGPRTACQTLKKLVQVHRVRKCKVSCWIPSPDATAVSIKRSLPFPSVPRDGAVENSKDCTICQLVPSDRLKFR